MNSASYFDMSLLCGQEQTIRLGGKYRPAAETESGKILPLSSDK
jgi:hypothetical protein